LKIKTLMMVGLTTAASVSLLAGCNSNSTQTSKNEGKSPEQAIKMMIASEPDTLDASKTVSAASFDIMNETNEGLYRLDKDGKPQPAVAAGMPEVSKDGLTYTIKLRDNATWADGSPLTAHDFEYAWKRTLDPNTKSEYAFMVAWIKGGEAFSQGKGKPEDVAVKAVDDKTLQFTLANPVTFMTSQLAFPVFFPQKKEFVEKQGEKYGNDAEKVLGNGPFKLEKWDHEVGFKLVKNDKYWDKDSVKLNTVEVQLVKDNNTAENLYTTDALDVVRISSEVAKRWKDKPDYHAVPLLWVWYLEMNETKPVFKNEKIRKALGMAVDREAYVKTIYDNGTTPASGFVPVNTEDGNGKPFRQVAGDVLPKFDPQQAKTLLAQGLQEAGLSSFPTIKLTGDDVEDSKKGLEFIQAQLKQNLGIDVDVESLPPKLRYQKGQKHDFDLMMFGWGADYNDPMTFLELHESKNAVNQSVFSDSDYDRLIAGAKVEPNAAKRSQMLVDAEKILAAKTPVFPIYFRTNSYLVKPNMKNVILIPNGLDWELKWASVE
jgi:oligopeptide transport system substrate-binding protein